MKNLILITTLFLLTMSCNNSDTNTETAAEPAAAAVNEAPAPQRQLRHVVLFKFKEGTTPEQITQVQEAFAALPGKIPQIKGFEWGTNNSPEGLDKGFTHCFFLTFDSEEDRAVYLPHPDHQAFGAVAGPHIEDVLVVDYWTASEAKNE